MTVNEDGIIYCAKSGEAKITATSTGSNVSATITVKVTNIVAHNQSELEGYLKDDLDDLTIDSSDDLTIPEGTYSTDLIVKGSGSVTNNGTFNTVTVAGTGIFTENQKNNLIVTNTAKVVVAKDAQVDNIQITLTQPGEDQEVSIENDGQLNDIDIVTTAKVTVTGDSKQSDIMKVNISDKKVKFTTNQRAFVSETAKATLIFKGPTDQCEITIDKESSTPDVYGTGIFTLTNLEINKKSVISAKSLENAGTVTVKGKIKADRVTTGESESYDTYINKYIPKTTSGKNLFDKSGVYTTLEEGYYRAYNTGVKNANTEYDSAIIKVDANKDYCLSNFSNVHVCFFDGYPLSNGKYISGLLNKQTFKTPSNTQYMSISYNKNFTDTMQVEAGSVSTPYSEYKRVIEKSYVEDYLTGETGGTVETGENIINIGEGYEYTSILKAMIDNKNKECTFVVHSGIYDLVEEYKAEYGTSYFDNYNGYGTYNVFDRGLNLNNGQKLIGNGIVEIDFLYNGTNAQVKERFSPINTTQNCEVDNITIKISDDSCRYHVHDDFAYGKGTNIFRNIKCIGVSHLKTAFGCGMGTNNIYFRWYYLFVGLW